MDEKDKPRYLSEFPNYDDVLKPIKGFKDSSIHQSACPSISKFLDGNQSVTVYQNYKSPNLRDVTYEAADARYSVFQKTSVDDEEKLILKTENFSEAKKAALACVKKIEHSQAPAR